MMQRLQKCVQANKREQERSDEKKNKGELKHVLKMASMQMRQRERLGCF